MARIRIHNDYAGIACEPRYVEYLSVEQRGHGQEARESKQVSHQRLGLEGMPSFLPEK